MPSAPFALARTPMYDQGGNMTRAWVLYFQSLSSAEIWLSVTDAAFGAVGDGVTDDTRAFNAALAAAALAGGSRGVMIPPPPGGKNYLITSTLAIPAGKLVIQGTGRLAPIVYTGSGPLFDTAGQSYVSFAEIFATGLGGSGLPNALGQIGVYINGAIGSTTLAAAITSPSATSISLTSAALMGLIITIGSEQMMVVNVQPSSGVVGVWRGYNGTTAATHLIGAAVAWSTASNTTNTSIADCIFAGFGTAQVLTAIGALASSGGSTLITTTNAPATGENVTLSGSNGAWSGLNGNWVATNISTTQFTVPFYSALLGGYTGAPYWSRPSQNTGAAIQVCGDNLSIEICWSTIVPTGHGIFVNSTTDMMNCHDVVIGNAPGQMTGWGILCMNSIGSGRNRYDHLNITCPGGMAYFGPEAGLIDFIWNQYEIAPGGGVPISNLAACACYFDSGEGYDIQWNNIEGHSFGNWGMFLANWNGAGPANNKFGDWNLGFISTAEVGIVSLDQNESYAQTPNYGTPEYLGIELTDWGAGFGGYRAYGTQYPQAPLHLNFPYVPFAENQTPLPMQLSAAINNSTTTVPLVYATASDLFPGQILYLVSGEQVRITSTASAPNYTVQRGINGTTAAAQAANTVVTFGPGAPLLLTQTLNGTLSAIGMGLGVGVGYLKVRLFVSGNTWVAIPLMVDNLTVQSQQPGVINTKLIIAACAGQADNLLEIHDASGVKKTWVDTTAKILNTGTLNAADGITCAALPVGTASIGAGGTLLSASGFTGTLADAITGAKNVTNGLIDP